MAEGYIQQVVLIISFIEPKNKRKPNHSRESSYSCYNLKCMRFVIIDESGRLYDPQDRIVIFAAVVTDSLVNLDKIIPSVRKHFPRKSQLAEIKFSTTGNKTRIKVLKEISKHKLRIFVLVINKEGRKIIDNPENYALLIVNLLQIIYQKYPQANHIMIDKHFSWIRYREKFNELVQEKIKRELFIEHLDSQQNTIVALPDFSAGALRLKYTKNQSEFSDIIKDGVELLKEMTWREIKQKEKVKA